MSQEAPEEGSRPELVEGQAALMGAIKAGDAERVRRWLDAHPDLVTRSGCL